VNTSPDTCHSTARTTINTRLYLACGSLLLIIFFMDLSVPLGVAMGVLYASVVLISLWAPRKRFTVLIAIVCALLTILAYALKPPVSDMGKVIFNRFLALFVIGVTAWLGLKRKNAEEFREKAVQEREKALQDIRILRGFLPICASCKKIRDDQGYWTQIESYIRDHSEAEFSHGLCPGCAAKLYPDYFKDKK
jgi:hypothetical protein